MISFNLRTLFSVFVVSFIAFLACFDSVKADDNDYGKFLLTFYSFVFVDCIL